MRRFLFLVGGDVGLIGPDFTAKGPIAGPDEGPLRRPGAKIEMCRLGVIKRKARADAWQGIGPTEAAMSRKWNVRIAGLKKGRRVAGDRAHCGSQEEESEYGAFRSF